MYEKVHVEVLYIKKLFEEIYKSHTVISNPFNFASYNYFFIFFRNYRKFL